MFNLESPIIISLAHLERRNDYNRAPIKGKSAEIFFLKNLISIFLRPCKIQQTHGKTVFDEFKDYKIAQPELRERQKRP